MNFCNDGARSDGYNDTYMTNPMAVSWTIAMVKKTKPFQKVREAS